MTWHSSASSLDKCCLCQSWRKWSCRWCKYRAAGRRETCSSHDHICHMTWCDVNTAGLFSFTSFGLISEDRCRLSSTVFIFRYDNAFNPFPYLTHWICGWITLKNQSQWFSIIIFTVLWKRRAATPKEKTCKWLSVAMCQPCDSLLTCLAQCQLG